MIDLPEQVGHWWLLGIELLVFVGLLLSILWGVDRLLEKRLAASTELINTKINAGDEILETKVERDFARRTDMTCLEGRFDSVDRRLLNIEAKIDNGLTTTTKENSAMLRDLEIKHGNIEGQLESLLTMLGGYAPVEREKHVE